MYQLYRNILFLRFIIGSFGTDVHCLRDGSFLCEISEEKVFLQKKTTFRTVVLLGEGIFTMGCSKNYIMYWGVFTLIIVPFSHSKVCTNFQKNSHSFYSICIAHKFHIENTTYFLHKRMTFLGFYFGLTIFYPCLVRIDEKIYLLTSHGKHAL